MADENSLNERLSRVFDLNSQAMALALAEGNDQWEALADLMGERQAAIESVFDLPLTEADHAMVREMAESVQKIDSEIFIQIKQKKQSIAQQCVALALGQLARSAYLASENDGL